MKIAVINPNTTAAMTLRIGDAARAVAAAGTQIMARNPQTGPASIEGYVDEVYSVPGLLQEIRAAEAAGAQGHVIACFDDTGLEAARCLAAGPVVGIGEAAFHIATLVAGRFSVITTLSRSIGAIEQNLRKYGLERRCARVRSTEVPVLELENPNSDAAVRISAEIVAALREDRAEAIVLGCAGMAAFAANLSHKHCLPVIDGVGCGVKLIEALGALKLATSRLGGYQSPLPKTYAGFPSGGETVA